MSNKTYLAIGVAALILLMAVSISSSGTSKRLSGTDFITQYAATPSAILLDVRTPSEFAAGHIDKAVNIDFEDPSFAANIERLDTAKTYFVYCRSGNRSGQAVSVMTSKGFKNIYELDGGLASNTNSIPLVTTPTAATDYVVDASDMIDGTALISGLQKSELSKDEIAALVQMREEEKLARDVYTTLGNIWGAKIFSNIRASEQTHADAMKVLLTRYAIGDPVTDDTVGSFTSKSMQDLYASLVAQGKTSITEALVVGATVEDLDINDLEKFKKATDKADIIVTYANLQKGSRNHLRAFVRNIGATGGSYEPRYISRADYDSIIQSAQEKGRL